MTKANLSPAPSQARRMTGRRPWIALLSMLFPLGWLWFLLHLLLCLKPARQPFLISHRGAAALAPENSLAGIQAAIQHGASWVEVDLQRSADGKLVLLHDFRVDRTTNGRGRVDRLTWDTLQRLDAGRYFAPQYTGEPLITLETALGFLADQDATLVIDVKYPGRFPGLAGQLAEELHRHQMEGRTWVIAFDHYWLVRFQQLAPQVPVGKIYIWMGFDQPTPPGRFVDVYWASVLADPTLVRRARANGYRVVVWTVNHPWLMRLLLWLGVEGITSDRPDLWHQVVSSQNA